MTVTTSMPSPQSTIGSRRARRLTAAPSPLAPRSQRRALPPADDRAAAIYVRISDDKEGAGLGVERQAEDCRRLAEQRRYRVVEVYADNDISAYQRTTVRPDYLRMMADLHAGRFAAVIVWHLDRLYRQPRELEDMIALCEQGERRVESCYGDYDLSNPDGCFMARLIVAQAQKESADKSRRITRKMAELAEQGRKHGYGRGYGYAKDGRSVVPEEAAAIREAAQRILAGDSLRSICDDFQKRGLTGTQGAKLGRTVLRNILVSGRISGQREHRGVIVAPGDWPAIITPEETARLRAVFNDPARRRPGRGVTHLLSGILRCGHCGARMVARRHDGKRTYVCTRNLNTRVQGCGRMGRKAEPVETLITEALFARFDSPEMARAVQGDQHDRGSALMAAIAEDQAQLTELAAAYAAKQITMAEWLAARGPIERRIEESSAEFAAVSRQDRAFTEYVGRGGALREDWSLLSIDQQRAIVASVLDHIVVEAAGTQRRTFDPSKIKPVWKV